MRDLFFFHWRQPHRSRIGSDQQHFVVVGTEDTVAGTVGDLVGDDEVDALLFQLGTCETLQVLRFRGEGDDYPRALMVLRGTPLPDFLIFCDVGLAGR